jgi:hypothetical protein
MSFTISRHVHERWDERFPHVDIAEAFTQSVVVTTNKLIHMLGGRPGNRRLKVKMGSIYRYDRESGALFIIGLNNTLVTVIDIGST